MSLITEAQIRGLVLVAEGDLSEAQLALWESLRIEPEVWVREAGAEHGFGFWVVARNGSDVLWYDSMSEGFCYGQASEDGILPEPEMGPLPLSKLVQSDS